VTGLAWTLLAVAAAAAVTDWIAVARRVPAVEYAAKPATLVLLIGVALTLDAADRGVRVAFVVALVLSLAGDVFLMLPGDRFVAGLASFLGAHLAYLVGFTIGHGSVGELLIGVAVTAAVAAPLGVRLARGVQRNAPALIVPVSAYVGAISAMVAAATGWGGALAVIGAWLFFTSDALIGETRFVRPIAGGALAIIVTYHLGQAALVLSLAD
jgi:uncharacterized membrane protein YhhN